MVDFRLYRLSFLPAVGAVIVIMFSLQGTPRALQPALPPAAFEGEHATAVARQLATRAPERQPGTDGDAAAAAIVAERFAEIPAGIVTEQEVESDYDGDEVALRNVVLTIPGEADGTIAIVAARASPSGPGAASSAAATGVLVELAGVLAASGHDHTFLLASTGDVPAGGGGVVEALELAPETDPVEAAVVISQPGAAEPIQPFVVASSADARSAPAQLARTAAEAVGAQVGDSSDETSAPRQLARLAIPVGIGPQARLTAAGIDSVAISAAGERPLPPSDDGTEDLSGASVDSFGRAVHATVAAIDAAPGPLEHGPDAHVELGDNLIPGWTLALLGLGLVLPAAVAAIDACARATRRGGGLGRGLAWAAARALPAIGALAALYGLALVGVVPRPEFPFDPGLHPLGARAAISLALIALAAVASAVLLHRAPVPGYGAAPAGALPAVGAIGATAVVVAWSANPYLGLLLAPCAHVWLVAAGKPSRGAAPAAVGLAAVASLIPVAAATAAVVDALDLGADAPWTLTLMVAGGQIGVVTVLAAAFLAATLVAAPRLAAGLRSAAIPPVGWGAPPRSPTGALPGDSYER